MHIKFVFYLMISAFLVYVSNEQAIEDQSLNEQEDELSSLIMKISNNLSILKKNPINAWYQNDTLFRYNRLRELFKKEAVESLEDIDEEWVNELGYGFWKKKNPAQTPHQLWLQTWALKQNLKRLKSMSNNFTNQREALYSYNALREKMNMALVGSWKDIDENWLEAQSYTFWKEHRQEGYKSQESLVESLILDINKGVALLHQYPNAMDQEKAVYGYNLLHELLGIPNTITTWEQIDLANVNIAAPKRSLLKTLSKVAPWLEMLAITVIVGRLAERMNLQLFPPPWIALVR